MNSSGCPTASAPMCSAIRVRLHFEVYERIADAHFEIGVYTEDGVAIAITHRDLDHDPDSLSVGTYCVDAEVGLSLLPGQFRIGVSIYRDSGDAIDFIERTIGFEVERYGTKQARPYRWNSVRGSVRPDSKWDFTKDSVTSSNQPIPRDTDGMIAFGTPNKPKE